MAEVNKDLVKIDYLQGMSYKDLADKHNMKVNTIKAWIKRYGWAKDREKIEVKIVPNTVPVPDKKDKKDKKKCTHVPTSKNEGTDKKKKVQSSVKIEEESVPIINIENSKLTDKQKLFCYYYVKYSNAGKAVKKAGYECSYQNGFYEIGSQLLKHPQVKAETDRLKAQIRENIGLDIYRLLQQYIDIALSDINDYMKYGQKEITRINEKTGEEETFKYNYVDFKESSEVDGTLISEIKQGKDGVSIKLIDKKWALDFLAKYSGLLDIPTKQKLDVERRKIEIAEKQVQEMDEDINYEIDEPVYEKED